MKCWKCEKEIGGGTIIRLRLKHPDGGYEELARHEGCGDFSAEDRAHFADRAPKAIRVGTDADSRYDASPHPQRDQFLGVPETIG